MTTPAAPSDPTNHPVWTLLRDRGWTGIGTLGGQSDRKEPLLFWAVANAPEAVPILLSLPRARRWVNASTPSKETPLMRTCRVSPSLVGPLLAAGAQVNAVEKQYGTTALMFACQHQPAAVSVLLAHGAEGEVQDNKGWSALHHACVHHPEVLPLLTAAAPAWKDNLTRLSRKEVWWCCTLNEASLKFMLEAGLDTHDLDTMLAKRPRPDSLAVWHAWKSRQKLERALEWGSDDLSRPRLRL